MPSPTKQAPTITDLPDRLPGETEKAYWRRVERCLIDGADVPRGDDLGGWTGSMPFHINREPV